MEGRRISVGFKRINHRMPHEVFLAGHLEHVGLVVSSIGHGTQMCLFSDIWMGYLMEDMVLELRRGHQQGIRLKELIVLNVNLRNEIHC